ncbi:MAG: hypothetical protein JWL98_1026, partial [Xanthomonadaceae bacterium]|nr:hypothetical protein [Xanthomonadaceae bacterium]
RSTRAEVVGENGRLALALRTLASPDAAGLAPLHTWAGRLIGRGFSSISVRTSGGRYQLMGKPVSRAFSVPMRGRNLGRLLWDDGYFLQRTLPVRDGAGIAGWLTTEQPMAALDQLIARTNHVGESGEMVVCGPGPGSSMACFPMRNRPRPGTVRRIVAGQRLPMSYALAAETGSKVAFDFRQHRVLAAYGPISDTGLGMVVKRDISEIYGPIRDRFQLIVVFLAALVGLTLFILRRRLIPLLHTIEDSRAQAVAAVESNMDAYFMLECVRDAHGHVLDLRYKLLNKRAERTLGRPRADVIGKGMCELFPERRTDGMLDKYVNAVENGTSIIEERSAVANNGMTRWYHLQAVKLGDGLGVTVRDITTARHAADRIRHQAMHDPLTGVANRAGFELALAGAIAEAQHEGHSSALALIDVDGFKEINDTLGHAAGDHLLQEIAARLRDCVRPSDTVARLGGDEFVIVLPHISYPGGAAIVAEKLIDRIALPAYVDGHMVAVTISVGISAYPADGIESVALLKRADAAMYRAKRAGRNGYAVAGDADADMDVGADADMDESRQMADPDSVTLPFYRVG